MQKTQGQEALGTLKNVNEHFTMSPVTVRRAHTAAVAQRSLSMIITKPTSFCHTM